MHGDGILLAYDTKASVKHFQFSFIFLLYLSLFRMHLSQMNSWAVYAKRSIASVVACVLHFNFGCNGKSPMVVKARDGATRQYTEIVSNLKFE